MYNHCKNFAIYLHPFSILTRMECTTYIRKTGSSTPKPPQYAQFTCISSPILDKCSLCDMAAYQSKSFAVAVSVGFLCFLVLAWHFSNDSRMVDGVVSGGEMQWWEVALLFYAIVAVLTNIVVSAKHAFSTGNSTWGWLNIILWPLSIYYTWRVVGEKP
jgi:hypothetical protein